MTNAKGFFELRIFTENNELKKMYQDKINVHNQSFSDEDYPDAGFDLLVPKDSTVNSGSTSKINHEVVCSMVYHTYDDKNHKSYYLYPRSSTGTKTPLRLSNSIGIIDSGYRGNIIAVFDNVSTTNFDIKKGTRLVQICAPNLESFMVSIVDNKEELGKTMRGANGFGSTGT